MITKQKSGSRKAVNRVGGIIKVIKSKVMKNLFYSLSIIASFFLFVNMTGCDPCANINCLNGGACVDGTCSCPTGYSGPRCEKWNPCATVDCKNGGKCNSAGGCDCPAGYSGPRCEYRNCETKNQSLVIFKNTSTNKTYNVFLDGGLLITLRPGESSPQITVNAGNRKVEYVNKATGKVACSGLSNYTKCDSWISSCSY
jgi:hypothetical protein